MTSNNRVSETCLPIDFHASGGVKIPANMGHLELPGKPSSFKQHVFHRGIESFFTDLIADELSRERHNVSNDSLECIKIWLYNTEQPRHAQGYQVPNFDEQDLEIRSPLLSSKLERVYVLDNGLSGHAYDVWKASCEALVKPLFSRFISPQEPQEILNDFTVMRFGDSLSDKLYLSLAMQANMFFNALIIQTD